MYKGTPERASLDTNIQLFTYFGCKKRIVERVWQAWGDVSTTVEPFAGTAVVSLSQPVRHNVKNMYINDTDCHIVNVLRSVIYEPEVVVRYAAHPRCELDLHMIHDYLIASRQSLRDFLGSHIDACDGVLAGWWIWGCNNWLGGGWCTDQAILKTPDKVALDNRDLDDLGQLTRRRKPTSCNQLTERLIGNKDLDDLGQLTSRIKPTHRNKLTERLIGTPQKKPTNDNKLTERLTDNDRTTHIRHLIHNVYSVLRGARILYGDFERVLTDTYTIGSGYTGIFLDPPYPSTKDGQYLYSVEDKSTFSRSLKYFLEHNDNEKLRMVFCCQEQDLTGVNLPTTIKKENWSRDRGYSKDQTNRHTEILLFSKWCL